MSETLQDILDTVEAMPRTTRFMWHDTLVDFRDAACMAERVARCWPVWPMGQRKRNVSGLRILPGKALSTWPMADGAGDVPGTVGSSAGQATPLLAYLHILGTNTTEKALDAVRDSWPERRAALDSLHRLLGGRPSALDALEALVFNEELPLLGGLVLRAELRRPIDGRVFRKLDPSPENLRFRDFAETQLSVDDAIAVPEDMGVWENFAVAMAFGRGYARVRRSSYRRARDPLSSVTVELAWRLLHLAPQFDTGRNPNDFGHSNHSGSIASADALAAAMVAVSRANPDRREAWSTSPLFQTVLIPATQDSGGDWHHGYMEAAAGHDGLDQPEVAWNLLCAGAFWVNRRGGNWRAYFDAALALAKRRRWTDCAAALQNMAERAQLN